MAAGKPVKVSDSEACVDAVIDRVGRQITLGIPVGLGKPPRFVNALYERVRNDPSLQLHILTGLSVQAPFGRSSLERRFLEPFTRRLYGRVPELSYARDAAAGALPDNVKVSEFFFQAGSFLNQPQQQRDYICSNYTHAARDLMARGINVIAQMVAPASADTETGRPCLSLSCNPDLTLDLVPLLRQREREGVPVALVAELNGELPWLGNHAAIPPEHFDVIFEESSGDHPLFSVPQTAVSPADHLIGFHASTLLRDGGTLQVGIGSLGTALFHSTILRHRNNDAWRTLYEQLKVDERFPVARECGGKDPFSKGLYGCSEMMVDGFIHLMEAGVLTRQVFDDAARQERINRGEEEDESAEQHSPASGVVMHGGFYLGPENFYEKLRGLSQERRRQICMTSINFINDLFDHRYGDQRLKVAQRVDGRFINSAMMQTLNGAAVSDGFADGRVLSGVGGQYNFVAMALELPGARSIITLPATRTSGGKTVSNILFNYGHCTIPRHLRDIVITEYGIADLRGQSDAEVCRRLIRIADARFQQDLLEQARDAGKIEAGFELPESWKENTPEAIERIWREAEADRHFPAFPFSCDFTEEELVLGRALKKLEAATATPGRKLLTTVRALLSRDRGKRHRPLLRRMALDKPRSLRSRLERRLLIHALEHTQ